MKILFLVSYMDGGTGIAARRIACALEKYSSKINIEIWVLKDFKRSFLKKVIYVILTKLKGLFRRLQKDTNPIYKSWGICSCGAVARINNSDADVIHIHRINEQFLSIKDISKIKKPIVWTLHDSWCFCGSEHYQNILEDDFRYKKGYKKNNFPKTSTGIDIDRRVWAWKKKCWENIPFNFTAPSSWEANCLEESALFKGYKCHVIPNCIDTSIFAPISNRSILRKKFNLSSEKKVLLFGAQLSNHPIKGWSFLLQALEKLSKLDDNLLLLCFGMGNEKDFVKLNIPYHLAGKISGDLNLAELYQCADVYITPSIIESFGQTALEAISCGIPVVAFNTTGIVDIIKHKENGYLAEKYSVDDLVCGILYCLDNKEKLGKIGREYALKNFSQKLISKKFEFLYENIKSLSTKKYLPKING